MSLLTTRAATMPLYFSDSLLHYNHNVVKYETYSLSNRR